MFKTDKAAVQLKKVLNASTCNIPGSTIRGMPANTAWKILKTNNCDPYTNTKLADADKTRLRLEIIRLANVFVTNIDDQEWFSLEPKTYETNHSKPQATEKLTHSNSLTPASDFLRHLITNSTAILPGTNIPTILKVDAWTAMARKELDPRMNGNIPSGVALRKRGQIVIQAGVRKLIITDQCDAATEYYILSEHLNQAKKMLASSGVSETSDDSLKQALLPSIENRHFYHNPMQVVILIAGNQDMTLQNICEVIVIIDEDDLSFIQKVIMILRHPEKVSVTTHGKKLIVYSQPYSVIIPE